MVGFVEFLGLSLFLFPCSWRDALSSQVCCRGRGWQASPHVVRNVLCEGDEGIAEVREQHRYPPSDSAARECGGNCRGRSSSLSEDYADRDLGSTRNLPTVCS